MKDIGFQAGRRYYETYGAVLDIGDSGPRLIQVIGANKIKLAVFTVNHGQDQLALNTKLKNWVEGHGMVVASFGDYRIYKFENSAFRENR